MKMKSLITSALLLLALLLPSTAAAYDFEVDGIYYKINGNEVKVTYQREFPGLYNDYPGTVVIPVTVTYNGTTYSVTAIGDGAFCYCSGLTNIVIPNSVTEIGSWAFRGCSELSDVYCYITDFSSVSCGNEQFSLDNGDYSGRTLHVLQGTADAYRADKNWYPYFGQIVEDIFMGD